MAGGHSTKTCPACKTEKSRGEFYKDSHSKDGLRYQCKECTKDAARRYCDANKEKVARTKRAYYLKNREAALENLKAYRRKNADRLKEYYKRRDAAKRPDKNRHMRDWQKRNPGYVRYSAAKRRAAKLKAMPDWADTKTIRDIYEMRPACCHVDHIIPLQGKTVCGLHVPENLQWLPAKDNLSKGNRLTGEFAEGI